MLATTWQTHLRAVHHAGRHAKANLVVAVVVVLESHARCIPLFVRTAAMRPRYLSGRVVINRCIAAIVTSYSVLTVVVTVDRAGNRHD